MSPENKQRLVGIVVLVAFVALLIPFLFTSGVKKKHELAPDDMALSSQATNVDMASQNIQLPFESNLEGRQDATNQVLPGELQVPAVPEVQPAALSTGQLTANPSQQAPAANDVVNIQVDDLDISPPVASKAEITNLKNVAPEKVVKTKKGKVVAKKSSILWSVQVGSFSDQARVQRLVKKIQASGFRVYLQNITTTRGPMVRVLVGREATKAKAIKIASQLKARLKLDGRVVGHKK